MPTLLIFAHECAPHNRPQSTVGAQRPAQFAKHLQQYGWRAVVICCDSEQRGRKDREKALAAARQEARHALREAAPAGSVVIATPSLAYDGARDYLWRKTFAGDKPRRGPLAVTARRLLTESKFYTGDWSQSWQPCARAAAEIVAERLKIDVVLGEHGPDAGLFLAHWFAAKHGVPWLADFRDPIGQGYSGATRVLYARAGKKLLETARGTINVTPFWTDLDRQMFGLPAWCIPNGYDEDDYPASVENPPNDALEITYAGNIIPQQRLDMFFEGFRLAVERLGAEQNRLRFVYRGHAHEKVAKMAQDAGITENTKIGPALPRAESLALLRQTQVLLLLSFASSEQEDVYFAEGFYPAKTFEYFGARRPILCVPGDGKLLDALLAEARVGATARSPAEVAAYLSEVIQLQIAGKTLLYQPDEAALARFSRRNLTGRLVAVLNHTVGLEHSPALLT
jgi:glycosyltransferase involved in cell wall biosynthesis